MNKKYILVIFILVVAINLFFGWSRLARYSAVDEPYWTYEDEVVGAAGHLQPGSARVQGGSAGRGLTGATPTVVSRAV